MGFNYGLEKKNFDRQWAIMRKQYEDAGMSIEVIQAMYEYDWSVFNATRSYQNHTQEIAAPSFEQGEPLYCETMQLIVAAWEGKPDSFRASVLKGMMHFVELYHGEFSEERLLRALRSIHPVDIYRIGQDDPAKLRGWKKYVFPIYTAYNGKCRKDALPMKF